MRAALCLLLVGCGAPYRFEQPAHPDVVVAVQDADLLEATERAAEQWARATGIVIGVLQGDVGDIGIRFEDPGTGANGGTEDPAGLDIAINPGLRDDSYLDRIVAHEIGHALESPEENHIPDGAAGLMTGFTIWDPRITAADLELICCGERPLVQCVALRSE